MVSFMLFCKKIVLILAIVTSGMVLVACGGSSDSDNTSLPQTPIASAPTPEPTFEPIPEPTSEPTSEPNVLPSFEPTPAPSSEPSPVPSFEPAPTPILEPTPMPNPVPAPELSFPISFDEPADIARWEVANIGGDVSVDLLHNVQGSLEVVPTWSTNTDTFIVRTFLDRTLDLTSAKISVDVYMPAAYVNDSNLITELGIYSSEGALLSIGYFTNMGAYTADGYQTITFDLSQSSTQLYECCTNADLTAVDYIGIKISANGNKDASVTGTIRLDNVNIENSQATSKPTNTERIVSDFTSAADIDDWEIINTNTGITVDLSHGADGSLELSPGWTATDNDFVIRGLVDPSANIVNGNISFDLFVPAAYVDSATPDNKLELSFILYSNNGSAISLGGYHNANFSFTGDDYTTISIDTVDSSSFYDCCGNADLTKIEHIGLKIEAGGKPVEIAGNFRIDNVKVTEQLSLPFALVVPDYMPVGAAAIYPNDDPTNTSYYFNGRVDTDIDSGIAEFNTAGSSLTTRFEGTSVTVKMTDIDLDFTNTGDSRFNVFVDADYDNKKVLVTRDGVQGSVKIDGLTDTIHTLEIHKRTDSANGRSVLDEITVDVGKSILPHLQSRAAKFEFYGDSITTGQHIEVDVGEPDPLDNNVFTNNYLSYAARTARKFNADYHAMSLAGAGLFASFNNGPPTMETLFDQANAARKQWQGQENEWDFRQWQADVVVVNLLTNDTNGAPDTDAEIIKQRYQAFLLNLRARYPEAYIFGVNGPYAINSKWTTAIIDAVREINAETSIQNSDRFFSYIFEDISQEEQGGHPRDARHQTMADELINVIELNTPFAVP